MTSTQQQETAQQVSDITCVPVCLCEALLSYQDETSTIDQLLSLPEKVRDIEPGIISSVVSAFMAEGNPQGILQMLVDIALPMAPAARMGAEPGWRAKVTQLRRDEEEREEGDRNRQQQQHQHHHHNNAAAASSSSPAPAPYPHNPPPPALLHDPKQPPRRIQTTVPKQPTPTPPQPPHDVYYHQPQHHQHQQPQHLRGTDATTNVTTYTTSAISRPQQQEHQQHHQISRPAEPTYYPPIPPPTTQREDSDFLEMSDLQPESAIAMSAMRGDDPHQQQDEIRRKVSSPPPPQPAATVQQQQQHHQEQNVLDASHKSTHHHGMNMFGKLRSLMFGTAEDSSTSSSIPVAADAIRGVGGSAASTSPSLPLAVPPSSSQEAAEQPQHQQHQQQQQQRGDDESMVHTPPPSPPASLQQQIQQGRDLNNMFGNSEDIETHHQYRQEGGHNHREETPRFLDSTNNNIANGGDGSNMFGTVTPPSPSIHKNSTRREELAKYGGGKEGSFQTMFGAGGDDYAISATSSAPPPTVPPPVDRHRGAGASMFDTSAAVAPTTSAVTVTNINNSSGGGIRFSEEQPAPPLPTIRREENMFGSVSPLVSKSERNNNISNINTVKVAPVEEERVQEGRNMFGDVADDRYRYGAGGDARGNNRGSADVQSTGGGSNMFAMGGGSRDSISHHQSPSPSSQSQEVAAPSSDPFSAIFREFQKDAGGGGGGGF